MLLKNKKIFLIVDVGPTPSSKFTKDYQSGALSFEIISNGKKLLSNCGYYQKMVHDLIKFLNLLQLKIRWLLMIILRVSLRDFIIFG